MNWFADENRGEKVDVVNEVAVCGLAVVEAAGVVIGGVPNHLATVEVRRINAAAADVGGAIDDDAIGHDHVVGGAQNAAGRIGQIDVGGRSHRTIGQGEPAQRRPVGQIGAPDGVQAPGKRAGNGITFNPGDGRAVETANGDGQFPSPATGHPAIEPNDEGRERFSACLFDVFCW